MYIMCREIKGVRRYMKEAKVCNVIVWGAGRNCKIVIECIRKDKCNFLGIIDSNKKKHCNLFMNEWKIYAPEEMLDETIDYIVISVLNSREILQQCEELEIDKDKIIDFWKTEEEYEFIDANAKRVYKLEKRVYELEKEVLKCKLQLGNIPFELGLRPTPIIKPAEELLEIIIKEKKSLSRFGDGELEIMQRRERPWFQKPNNQLAARLKDVFECKEEKIVVALADDFGNLEHYTEESANAIRNYLSGGIREKLMTAIDMDRIYYDAYVTRPYLMYKDRQYAIRIFKLFKKIWKKRNILLIEGKGACIGVRNDLLEGASSVRRIIAPSQNAFSDYEKILFLAKKHSLEDTLVLISLGPTATVLAYDLAMEGIQALDIGQLDNEYEWYLRGAEKRIAVPGKCVAEVPECHEVEMIEDKEYEKQIVGRV